MKRVTQLYLLFLVGLLAQPATGQHLVKDLNTTPIGINPRYFQATGSGFLFLADTPGEGEAIWLSDGTEAGTSLAIDTSPGPADMQIHKLTAWGDWILFWESSLQQMMVSDGTQAGTHALTGFWQTGEPFRVVPTPVAAFFTLNSPKPGELRYTLPGTNTTQKVAYVCPADDCHVNELVVFRDSLYFGIKAADHSNWIWRVGLDGANPEAVAGPFDQWIGFEGQVGDRLLLLQRDEQLQWVINAWEPGSPFLPLHVLTDPNDGLDFRIVGYTGAKALMHLSTYAEYPVNYLIATDGTPQGTEIVQASNEQQWPGNDSANLPDGTLLFPSWSQGLGHTLWTSDGTADGTGPLGNVPDPVGLTLVGSEVYFCGTDDVLGEELWKTDGTVEGTVAVADIYPGPGSGQPGWLVEREGRLYFRGITPDAGKQVMSYDPVSESLAYVTRSNVSITAGSYPRDFVASMGRVTFRATDPDVAASVLWTSDGSASNTSPVVVPGFAPGGTDGRFLTDLDGKKFWHGISGLLVHDMASATWSGIALPAGWPDADNQAIAKDGLLAFGPRVRWGGGTGSSTYAHEIWVTDGTQAGTRMIHTSPDGIRSIPVGWALGRWLVAEDGKLLAVTDDQIEILMEDPNMSWRTRGIDAGAFTYLWNENEYGLWVTDGTPQGSRRINSTAWLMTGYAFIDGDLIHADWPSGGVGRELVRRSHPDSVIVVSDIRPGPPGSDPATIRDWNDRVLFTARPAGGARQVWISDGTQNGTHALIADLDGAGSDDWEARLFMLGATDHGAVFSVGHGTYGREPWYTDGTPDGTLLLADINPGPEGSDPQHGGRAGDMILFDADPGGYRPELYGVSLAYLASDSESNDFPSESDLIGHPWPNPARSALTLPLDQRLSLVARIEIFDILGRRHVIPNERMGDHIRFDTSRLPAGVYFIRSTDEGRTTTRRFIKQD